VPCVVFPPASGDKGKLIVSDDVLEVPSMSRMMKESILQGAQTPAVMFDLVERLQKLGVDTASVLEDGDESDDESASETAPAPKGKTRSVLDE
jgi:hypothetical protein